MSNSSHARASRPSSIQSKSFSRFEPPSQISPSLRNRATTIQGRSIPETLSPEKTAFLALDHGEPAHQTDVFEQSSTPTPGAGKPADSISDPPYDSLPEGFDQLPIELISLADRFIASLTTAKVYSTPPSIEKLADLFQDFYTQAESHISTHIQTLSSRQYREASPNPSISSKTSINTKGSSRLKVKASRDTLNSVERVAPEQQMLTPNEVSERRKARRLLEHKRIALEEAVEKRVCEGIYDRIWRHRGTLDEIRDEKLRSRTAALALVGIGLKDLGIDFDASNKSDVTTVELEIEVEKWISKAKAELLKMNESKNPLGKLQSLASTHQNIVDLLTQLHQSSSSADEILPTLIYTLISSPPHINIISNLNFIQRFRSASKINGEAAYCLTNLEAAITFLETVDLATLRADEAAGPPKQKSSRPSTPSTPRTEGSEPWPTTISSSTTQPDIAAKHPAVARPDPFSMSHPLQSPPNMKPSPPTSPSHQRRLSSLFQTPPNAFGVASDAVRTTADQGMKSISNTLDSSFKLLFGRLKEQQVQGDGSNPNGEIIVPRTLDDARKLVSPRPFVDEEGNISEASSFTEPPEGNMEVSSSKLDDRLLDLIGGRKQIRDRSVDSVVSTGSGKRVAFATESVPKEKGTSPISQSTTLAPASSLAAPVPNAAVESMRNLGNTLNPLNRLAGINVMRGFGRSASTTPPPASVGLVQQSKEPNQSERTPARVEPPVQRFLDIDDARELKIGDVADLLKDYRRLAGVLKNLGVQ